MRASVRAAAESRARREGERMGASIRRRPGRKGVSIERKDTGGIYTALFDKNTRTIIIGA
ncbi:hypothetical protein D3C83_253110 [compost metagenome]